MSSGIRAVLPGSLARPWTGVMGNSWPPWNRAEGGGERAKDEKRQEQRLMIKKYFSLAETEK